MTTRRGYTPSRPYQLKGTNRVYHDLRGSTIPAMSPRTRTSFMSIRLVLDSWAIPRGTLGSPRLTHLHHHHSHPRRQLPPAPHSTSRTRCSPLLSALMLSGTRPRSTESSSRRTWRRFALICVRYSSAAAVASGPASPASSSPPVATTTTTVTCPFTRGVPFTFLCYFFCQWGHCTFLFGRGWGGGGGGGWSSGFS